MLKQVIRRLKSHKWLVIPPVLVGAAILAVFVMSKKELPRLEVVERPLQLPVLTVRYTPLTPWATGFGTAKTSRRWAAISEVKGRVIETHPSLDSGRRVLEGELLVQIDKTDYELRLAQRLADQSSMEAKLAELDAAEKADIASLALAKKIEQVAIDDWNRMKELYEQSAVSEGERDSAHTVVLQQQQAIQNLENSLTLYPSKRASAKASIALAESQVKEAQREIARTTIYSPFNGILSGVALEQGQIVGQNQQLFEVRDDQRMEIEARVSLGQLEKVWLRLSAQADRLYPEDFPAATDARILAGLTASVTARSGNLTHEWHGRAIRISEALDQQTRTLGIVIEVNNDPSATPNPDTSGQKPFGKPSRESRPAPLRSGTFCEITLRGQAIPDAIVVPRTALDDSVVYIIDDQNRLRARPVEIDFAMGESIAIASGLQPGDRVATAYPVPAIEGKLIDPQMDSETTVSDGSQDILDAQVDVQPLEMRR